jgi:uncharacterized hydrophobic protein (TIGR00271 family)
MKQNGWILKVLSYFNLESEVDDFDKIHQNIEKDIIFKGTNLWILMFAIIIASVGLNMNSTAVIIGAMLISPLMGPINGMGYSIATYNFPLFRKAIKNFTFAVIASLIASTAYFAMSPISTAHSELLARTSPTIYDVLIALFGGLAGIVAISSRHKGNVIPGVAIATALMPPLCTAGYGLASGQFYYFFGAFYLFTINTVFIAISSIIISQILKFPIRTIVDVNQKKNVTRWTSFIIILVLIPSIYFGYDLVKNEKFIENATKYVNSIRVIEGNYLLKNEINPQKKTITLIYGGSSLNEEQKNSIVAKATDFGLQDVAIVFQQGFSFDAITQKTSEVDNLKTELNRLTLMLDLKDKQLDSLNKRNQIGQQILDEIHALYPQIEAGSFAESYVFNTSKPYPDTVSIVYFTVNKKSLSGIDKQKIEKWLNARLKIKRLKVVYEN